MLILSFITSKLHVHTFKLHGKPGNQEKSRNFIWPKNGQGIVRKFSFYLQREGKLWKENCGKNQGIPIMEYVSNTVCTFRIKTKLKIEGEKLFLSSTPDVRLFAVC